MPSGYVPFTDGTIPAVKRISFVTTPLAMMELTNEETKITKKTS
jgi:hypothetical protein